MLRAIVSLWVVLMLVGVHSYARACSCAQPPPALEALAQAVAVFEGELLDSCSATSNAVTRDSRFRVLRAWKGVAADAMAVVRTATSSAACGYDTVWTTGAIMLVYAGDDSGVLTTNICMRTRLSSDAQDDIAALGVPSSVSAGGSPVETDASCLGTDSRGDAATDTKPVDRRVSSACIVSGPWSGSGRSTFVSATLILLGFFATKKRQRRS